MGLKEDKCDYANSNYEGDEPNKGDCEKYFGRCKPYIHTFLCSKKKNQKGKSSCCQPYDSELCPFGIYPFGLKSKNGLVDWRVEYSSNAYAWTKACENLTTNAEFADAEIYISNKKCCAKAKMYEDPYYGNFLSDQYDRVPTTACKNDADCGEDKFCGALLSTYNSEPAKGQACFQKIHCPHKNKTIFPVRSTDDSFICTDSRTCPEDTICIWGKPAAATATKIKKSFGMCCPKVAYETDVCTAKLLGYPLNKNTGLIDRTIRDQKDCKDGLQKWGTIDTGAGGTGEDKTQVCCQYPPVYIDRSTCTAVIMGKRVITGIPIRDPKYIMDRYLYCDKEKKRRIDEPKINCDEKRGFCFDHDKVKDLPGVCCDTGLCPDGITALSDVPICDDKCMWSNSAEKGKYCVADKKNVTKCCPPKFIPAPDWRSGRYEPNAPKNTEATKTNVSCVTTMDCGGYGTFCEEKEKLCYRLGTQQYDSSKHKESCTKAADCKHADYKDYKWWCVAFGPATGHLHCVMPPQPKPTTKRPPATTTPPSDSASSPLHVYPFVILWSHFK